MSLAPITFAQAGYLQKKNADGTTDYKDKDFGVSFRLPRGWHPFKALRWTDTGWEKDGKPERATTVSMRDSSSRIVINLYYRLFSKLQPMSSQEIDNLLMSDVDDKASQRKDKDKLKGYHLRANGYEQGEIHGQRALACIADFKQGNHFMVEYLVWVRNEKSSAEFFLRVPADQFDEIRGQVKPIIQSLRLP